MSILYCLVITISYIIDLYDKIKLKFSELTQYKIMFAFL